MPVMDTRTALAELLHLFEANTCRHEDTHRGGTIWTICDRCDRKWADDQGGFQPYEDPQEVINARAALASVYGLDDAVEAIWEELERQGAETQAEVRRRDGCLDGSGFDFERVAAAILSERPTHGQLFALCRIGHQGTEVCGLYTREDRATDDARPDDAVVCFPANTSVHERETFGMKSAATDWGWVAVTSPAQAPPVAPTPTDRIATALETIATIMTAEPPATGPSPLFRLGYDFGAGMEQVGFSIGQQIKRGMDAG